ncbi:DUF3187 family protein [Vibrio profundum]|uniref:DUF3187 family protein n=1 Tax=Vibrio profundum TaxID=2910247 RepID=UPI003D0C7B90
MASRTSIQVLCRYATWTLFLTPSTLWADIGVKCDESQGDISCPEDRAHSSPFRTYPASPMQALSLTTQLRSAETVKQTEVFMVASAASVWARSAELELDYYQNQVLTGIQWQIADRLSAEVQYQYSWAGNNHLDPITVDFHDWVGLEQNGRLEEGNNQYNIDSNTYNLHINDFENDTMLSAVHGYLQWQVLDIGAHALALGGSLYYNKVNDSAFAASSFEQGIQVNYSYIRERSVIFSTLGGTIRSTNDDVFGQLPTKRFTGAWALGYGYKIFDNHELMLEYHGYEGTLEDDSELSKASQEVVLGYRYYLQNFAQFELSATENIYNMDNSTDIVFSAGLRLFLAEKH